MLSGEERNFEGIRDRTQEGQNPAPPKSQSPFLPLRPASPTLKNGPREKSFSLLLVPEFQRIWVKGCLNLP